MRRTLLLALTLTACTSTAQTIPRYVVLDQHVRNVLAADWDAHAADTVVLERVYCLTYQRDVWILDEWVWKVTEIEPAAGVVGAGPSSVLSFKCPPGPNVTTAHVHPFQTCLNGQGCVPGGVMAGQCYPSDTDERYLHWTGQPFAMILCGRDAAVPYWRHGL